MVSYFLGEIQCTLMLEMPLRRVLLIICEFSKGPLNSLNLFSGEECWKGISSVPRSNTSNCAFVIKRRSNGNLDLLDKIL